MYGERGALYGTGERPDARKARAARRARGARVARAARLRHHHRGHPRQPSATRYGARARTRVIPNGCDVPADRAFPGLAAERPPRVALRGPALSLEGRRRAGARRWPRCPSARLVILGGLEGEPDFDARARRWSRRAASRPRTEMPGTVPQAQVAQELRAGRGGGGAVPAAPR